MSAHAAQRLERRNIQLPEEEWARINAALDRAAEKGARDSLVLADGLAMVVNVPNRTVITVLSPDETRENIFTQIDSAVVLPARPKNFGIRPDPLAGGLHAADRMMRRNLKETQS